MRLLAEAWLALVSTVVLGMFVMCMIGSKDFRNSILWTLFICGVVVLTILSTRILLS